MPWEKISTVISGQYGEKTITYKRRDSDIRIESRKRAIPHANGRGVWMHTSYFVIWPDGREREFYSLADAKAAAEGR